MTEHSTDNADDEIERPWLDTEDPIVAIDRLRDDAASVGGEPCDEWYAKQLGEILQSVDTDGAFESPYEKKVDSIAVVLDEFPPMQILDAVQKLAEDPESLMHRGDVLTIASNLSTDEEMERKIGLSEEK